MSDLNPYQWRRGCPLADDCPKGFHFGDYVETNDRIVSGFVRGIIGQQDPRHTLYLIQTHEDGDVIPLFGGALQLVFRIDDPEARAIAIQAYKASLL